MASTTKGQVILPAAIRQQKRWEAGMRLTVEESDDGILLRAAPHFPETGPEEVFASLPSAGAPKTLEGMDAGVLAEAKRRHAGD
jgi:AbrB family looped-hinge helix DNA binding protein